MSITRRDLLVGAAATAPLVLSGFPAIAQNNWPSRDITVVCGYAPGTGADILVRHFAARLGTYTQRTMIVENRPGAGTSLATEFVVRARPDGHTLFINPGNGLAGNPYLYTSLPHDVVNDLAPVTTLVRLPFMLAVHPDSPANNVEEFLALMREKGADVSYGYPNNISLAAGELLKARTGIEAVRVAYKSTPEALTDLTNGLIDFLWSDATFALGQQRAGRMKLLAVTPNERSALAPDLPTMQESGVPDFHLEAWWGAWYPAGTPEPIIRQTAEWLNEILESEETRTFLAGPGGSEPFPGTPESAAAYLQDDIPRWAAAFELAGVERQ